MKTITDTEPKLSLLPMGPRIIIKQDAAPTETASGLILTGEEKPLEGEVLAIGPDVKHIAQYDRVLFAPYAGSKLNWKGVEYIVMREDDVLCVDKG